MLGSKLTTPLSLSLLFGVRPSSQCQLETVPSEGRNQALQISSLQRWTLDTARLLWLRSLSGRSRLNRYFQPGSQTVHPEPGCSQMITGEGKATVAICQNTVDAVSRSVSWVQKEAPFSSSILG